MQEWGERTQAQGNERVDGRRVGGGGEAIARAGAAPGGILARDVPTLPKTV